MHANTVTYRLQGIEQLIPLRLSDSEEPATIVSASRSPRWSGEDESVSDR